jgi:anti-sigma B factor antagonist
MEISENKVDNIIVVSLGGRIDSTAAVEFEEKLIKYVDAGARTMVVDFQKVQFISSAGLRVLLLAAKKVKPYGGKIILSGMSKDVREVFDISGFSSIFEIHDDQTSAVNAAKKIVT